MVEMLCSWICSACHLLPSHLTIHNTQQQLHSEQKTEAITITAVSLFLSNLSRKRDAMVRRLLALACMLLAIAPLQSASGEEVLKEGLQEADSSNGGVDLDAVLDDLDAGATEVSCGLPSACQSGRVGNSWALTALHGDEVISNGSWSCALRACSPFVRRASCWFVCKSHRQEYYNSIWTLPQTN